MPLSLERILAARRESRRIIFRPAFHAGEEEWRALLIDVAALANSGGGAVLFGVDIDGIPINGTQSFPDERVLAGRWAEWAGAVLDRLELLQVIRQERPTMVLMVGEAVTPLLSPEGVLYMRRGLRSEPARTEDLAALIARRLRSMQREWLKSVRRAVRQPWHRPQLPPEIRDSDSPSATPIRIVEDPRAPAYRIIDYDKTHPYRQKELLSALRERLPGRALNQFDLLAVRHMHGTDERTEFSHQSLFGTRQYSQRFLEWLVEQAERDPQFFDRARADYILRRRA